MLRVSPKPDEVQQSKRKGSVTLEFIIAFPIIFIATLAIAIFFFLALTLEVGTVALIEGTRQGAELYPVSYPLNNVGVFDDDIADQVAEIMDEHLSVHNVEVADPVNGFDDEIKRQNATVVIERDPDPSVTRPNGGSTNQLGQLISCSRVGTGPDMNEIVVTLCFEIVDASNPEGCLGPVPDWLSTFGFSLAGCTFEVSARAGLE